MKTKEISTKPIYITIVTSGMTLLANKVARVLQPHEDVYDVCSELANEIAEENGLNWSNVLYTFYRHYKDEYPVIAYKMPKQMCICCHCKKRKFGIETGLCNHCGRFGESQDQLTRKQALAWWNELSQEKQIDLQYIYRSPSRHPLNSIGLTGREIKEIWLKETTSLEVEEMFQDGRVKQFDESLFRAYIDKFSEEDKVRAFEILFKNSNYLKLQYPNLFTL